MHQQGLADRSEAIRLKPDMAEAWCARGSAYFLLGDYEKAVSDLNQALRLKSDYEEAHVVLAKAQRRRWRRHRTAEAAKRTPQMADRGRVPAPEAPLHV